MGVHFSSERMDWPTPAEVFDPLHAEFGFTLDAAAAPHNCKVPLHFTADDDALAQDWGTHTVWLNPPYGRLIGLFIRKAWLASKYGATVVCLIPSRTDTDWWHRYIQPHAEVRFIRGRIRFEGAPASAPFPSAVVVFRARASTGET